MKKNGRRPKKAVALTYEENQHTAPVVRAKGSGYVAENMIKLAKENDLPIMEDASLVECLTQLNISEEIPSELYEVVAEVFLFVYRLDQEFNGK